MLKSTLLTLALTVAAGAAVAQKEPAKAPAAAKPAAKPAGPAKKASAEPTKKVVKKAPPASAKSKAAAVPVATPVPVAEAVLGAAELAIAERVHVGALPCELGHTVHLTADAQRPGYFDLQLAKTRYRLVPVQTSTGAIRLEDAHSGAVWLQLANKSMLMNHKLGQRMADECKSPEQVAVAEQFKTQPPPSVLDAAPAQAGTSVAAQPAPSR